MTDRPDGQQLTCQAPASIRFLTRRTAQHLDSVQQRRCCWPHSATGLEHISLLSSAGDPYNETNWGWFEDQKKVKTGIRLRFGLGGTDDLDGLEENHDPFVEVQCPPSPDAQDQRLPTADAAAPPGIYQLGQRTRTWSRTRPGPSALCDPASKPPQTDCRC